MKMDKRFNKRLINENKKFWVKFQEDDSAKLLLVETSNNPVINHSNAVVAKIIAQAKNLRIAWIKYPYTDEDLMLSYSSNSLFISFPKINLFKRILFLWLGLIYYFFYILIKNNPLSFKYREIPYGDFVYDGYLSHYKMATLHKLDPRIVMIFFRILLNDEKARLILAMKPIKAVLLCHYINLSAGPIFRVTLQHNIPCYVKTGGHQIVTLNLFQSLKEIYNYVLKPSVKEINILTKKHKARTEKDFRKLISKVDDRNYGAFSVAYNNKLKSKITKSLFLKTMKLANKPIVFVMLHAFNDHPHSHFAKMLFKDYYDWFIKTVNFARQDITKNWIFKEHPSNEFYTTKDLNLKKLMVGLPKHIRFLSFKSKIKASTVLNVADMIVTCLGTSGVEMPALKATPSIIASDTFYDGFGFTIEPKSEKQYFNVLKNAFFKILPEEKQLRAKACFLYIKYYTCLPFAAGPAITFEESMKPQELKKYYGNLVSRAYYYNRSLILRQFNQYVKEIKKSGFKRLLRIPIK